MKTTLTHHQTLWLDTLSSIEAWSTKTIKNYSTILNHFHDVVEARPLSELRKSHIEAFVASIRPLQPRTRAGHLSCVKRFLTWAGQNELANPDLTAHIPRVRVPKTVPRSQSYDATDALWKVLPDKRARVIVILLEVGAMRVGEVAKLQVHDIDFRSNRIGIYNSKNGDDRVIPLPPKIKRLIKEYMKESGHTGGPLIRSYTEPEKGVTANYVSQLMTQWWYRAGVKRRPKDGVNAHALRHTGATRLFDATDDLFVVKEFLGHTRISTTEGYTRVNRQTEMKEALDKMAS